MTEDGVKSDMGIQELRAGMDALVKAIAAGKALSGLLEFGMLIGKLREQGHVPEAELTEAVAWAEVEINILKNTEAKASKP